MNVNDETKVKDIALSNQRTIPGIFPKLQKMR